MAPVVALVTELLNLSASELSNMGHYAIQRGRCQVTYLSDIGRGQGRTSWSIEPIIIPSPVECEAARGRSLWNADDVTIQCYCVNRADHRGSGSI